MAFDFPNAPTTGQIVTGPNGIQYQWDGVKWIAATNTVGGPFLPLTGGTLTGPLAFNPTTAGNATISLSDAAGNARSINFQTAGVQRWQIGANNAAETGNPTGSDFTISRYDDSGNPFGVALTIARNNGLATFSNNLTVSGNFVAANNANVNGGALILNAPTTSLSAYISITKNSLMRWQISANNNTESGSNAGSNFQIASYGDTGSFIGNVFVINRATGVLSLTAIPTHPTPPAGDNSTNSATTAFVAPAVQAAADNTGRNLLHNAQFNIQQRGPGPFTTQGFTADRWFLFFASTGGSCSATYPATTLPNGFSDESITNYLSFQNTAGTGAGDYSMLSQSVEGVRRLSGKTVTISFTAWAASGTPRVGIEFEQAFGTGGSPSTPVSAIGAQAFTLSTTAQRFTATVALPSVSGKTFGTNNDNYTHFNFWFSSGSTYAARASNIGFQTNTFYITGVQLEFGSIATPLVKRDPADDLALCQRFFIVLPQMQATAYAPAAGNTTTNSIIFPVTMRASPTIAQSSTSAYNCSGWSMPSPSPSCVQTWLTGCTAGTSPWFTATLQISAELT